MKEEQLQIAICNYLKLQYPKVLFNVDLSGIRLTIGQATKAKKMRSGRAFPDMVIYQPNSVYHALFMELKRQTPYKKDGFLKADKHLKEQETMLLKLEELGYRAFFVWDFEQAKRIIDEYLRN